METKKCSVCKNDVQKALFTNNKLSRDGLEPRCKICASAVKKAKADIKRGYIKANRPPMLNIANEIWLPVEQFEDSYAVSNKGRVKSIERDFIACNGAHKFYPSYILSPATNADGYSKVSMSIIGEFGERKQKLFSVHRLVASAFLKNENNYPTVNHINAIKTDNRVENLEWCTCKENSQHASLMGLFNPKRGEAYAASKLTNESVLEIRAIGKSKTIYQIADMFNISFQHVSEILNRKCWKHI